MAFIVERKSIVRGLVTRFSWRKIIDIAAGLYFLVLALRFFLSLILQCTYLRLQELYLNEVFFHNNSTNQGILLKQIQKVDGWMVNCGLIYRKSRTMGILMYSLFFSIPCVFYWYERMYRKKITEKSFKKGFVSFLKDPTSEFQRLNLDIDIRLDKVIESNINYKHTIEAIIKLKSSTITSHQFTSDEFCFYKHKNQLIGSSGVYNHCLIPAVDNSSLFDNHHSKMRSFWLDNLLIRNQYQMSHLTYLYHNKSSIWPSCRDTEWAETVKKLWFYSYIILTPICWFLGQYTVYFIQRMALNILDGNFGEYDNSCIDWGRLLSVEEYVTLYYGVELSISSALLVFLRLIDQLKHLKQIDLKLKKLELYHAQLKQQQQQQKDSCCWSTWERLNFKCDKEAIELYLTYQLFIDDSHSFSTLCRVIMEQRVYFAIVVVLPTLAFADQILPVQIRPIVFSCLMILFGINACFLMCAYSHAAFIRTTRQIWSMLARSLDSTQLGNEEHQIYINSWNKRLQTHVSIDSTNRKLLYSQPWTPASLTPHTIQLWQRLVCNQDQLMHGSLIKAFNVLPLDYNGILKINFWLFSGILLSLTYKR